MRIEVELKDFPPVLKTVLGFADPNRDCISALNVVNLKVQKRQLFLEATDKYMACQGFMEAQHEEDTYLNWPFTADSARVLVRDLVKVYKSKSLVGNQLVVLTATDDKQIRVEIHNRVYGDTDVVGFLDISKTFFPNLDRIFEYAQQSKPVETVDYDCARLSRLFKAIAPLYKWCDRRSIKRVAITQLEGQTLLGKTENLTFVLKGLVEK